MGIGVTQIRVFEGLKEVVIFGPGLGTLCSRHGRGAAGNELRQAGDREGHGDNLGPGAAAAEALVTPKSLPRAAWPRATGYGLRYLAPRSVLALWGGLSVAGQTDPEAEPRIHPSDATTAPDISLEIQIQHLKQQCCCRQAY